MNLQQEALNNYHEELIYLDELAGELDLESNIRINARRQELVLLIKQLEKTVDQVAV
jgi:hypothetical protein